MRTRWIPALILTLAGITAVFAAGGPSTNGPSTNGRLVLISHAADSDVWWNTVKNAIRQAGDDYGVQVAVTRRGSFAAMSDAAEVARFMEMQP